MKTTLHTFLALFLCLGAGSLSAKDHKTVGEKLDQAVEKTEEGVKEGEEKAKELAENAKEKAKELHEDAKELAHEGIEKL